LATTGNDTKKTTKKNKTINQQQTDSNPRPLASSTPRPTQLTRTAREDENPSLFSNFEDFPQTKFLNPISSIREHLLLDLVE
jgi:hypothetical protein